MTLIQNSLIQCCMETEKDASVRHQICDAIGEIAGSLYDLEKPWFDLIPIIFKCLEQPNPEIQDSALRYLLYI